MTQQKKIIIAVGRQEGSGGREIASRLADVFGARLLDNEILMLAAKESGFSQEFFARNDEKRGILRSFLHLPYSILPGGPNLYQDNISEESLFKFQSDAIRKAAEEGSCVFVGRCADYVLRDFKEVVNVFVTAPMDFRVEQVMRRMGVDKRHAERHIEETESRRAAYYNYFTGKKWGNAASYDLSIDSSILGIDETERFVAEFVRRRAAQE